MNDELTSKNTTDEDWEVSSAKENLPPNVKQIPPIEEWAMTGKLAAPNQQKPDGWTMPEPKFQATSGALPPDFPGKLRAEPPPAASAAPVEKSAPPLHAAPPVAVEPQPEILDSFTPAPPAAPAPAAQSRSTATRIVLAVFGLAAMLIFAAAFLMLVYYFFIYKPPAQ